MNNFNDYIEQKIVSRDNLSDLRNRLCDKKIVFTNGCFDVIHYGHVNYLAKARNLGDFLFVGLNSDDSVKRLKGKNRPINREFARASLLAAFAFVDFVCIFDEDTPENLIHQVKPNILVKGGDYSVDNIVGADFVIQNGGIVTTIPFVDGYSSSKIINMSKKISI